MHPPEPWDLERSLFAAGGGGCCGRAPAKMALPSSLEPIFFWLPCRRGSAHIFCIMLSVGFSLAAYGSSPTRAVHRSDTFRELEVVTLPHAPRSCPVHPHTSATELVNAREGEGEANR